MGVARLRAALDADGFPLALDVRTAMDETAPGNSRLPEYRDQGIDHPC
jgi:hypothetical protein